MTIGKILPKDKLLMTFHQASTKHPENGEEIDISISGASPVITYKGKRVYWDIQEMIREAVDLIDIEEKESGSSRDL